uniref:Gag-pol polyprotein n=1 Tax=Solanum tuberosum TaxID=4113 RepID=M1DEV9_SOLTU
MTLQSRPSKRLHLEISDFDTVALKFGLDPFPTQFDPLNKNMKSDFRKTKRILRYMEITIIGVSKAHFRDMTTRRANARRFEEGNVEQEIHPQVPPQAPLDALIDPLNENVTNVKFKSAFRVFAQVVTPQTNREVV